jgi:hypothetical protein
MTLIQGPNHKRFCLNGKEFQMVWDTNSVAAPEGCLVIAVDFSKPAGKREIFRKSGLDTELESLRLEAERLIQEAARQSAPA